MDWVREHLGAEVHPVHRLDRQTSGVLLLAKGADAARRWQRALAEPTCDKRYVAMVRGCLSAPRIIEHPLRDEDGVAHEARSEVEPLCVREGEARSALVLVRIFTGRTHQVRRHLKHISHPVLGDSNYGKQPLNRWFRERFGLPRMALHARSLEVVRDDGERVRCEAPVPDDLAHTFDLLFAGAWREALAARPVG
jgi:tRNA pseudouridine65 synthase